MTVFEPPRSLPSKPFVLDGIPGEAEVWSEIEPIGLVGYAADFHRRVVVAAEFARSKQASSKDQKGSPDPGTQ